MELAKAAPSQIVTECVILIVGEIMIYCDKIKDYVDQEERCFNCIFYKIIEDTCDYENWHPGLKKDKDE